MPRRRIINRLGSPDSYSLPLGGPGSGHHGHLGRPGERGGSLPGGGAWVQKRMDFGKLKTKEVVGAEKLRLALRDAEMTLHKMCDDGSTDEYCFVFDSEGKKVLEMGGQGAAISIDWRQSKLLKDGIFTHSHPLGWEQTENDNESTLSTSFSRQDIFAAMEFDLAEIRAVSNHYIYRMVRPDGGWGDYDTLDNAVGRGWEIVTEMFARKISMGEITHGYAGMNHNHEIWVEVTRQLGWQYERTNYLESVRGRG